jgi:hypothetical protein
LSRLLILTIQGVGEPRTVVSNAGALPKRFKGNDVMTKGMIGVLTGLVLAVAGGPQSASAAYCGAACYNNCPTAACQPTACYTTCRVERQTCYRTVYDTVQEPQSYVVNRTTYETAYDDVPQTCYRTVVETNYREESYQVQRPIYETAERVENYTVMRPVTETVEREVRRCVMRQVTETVNQERCYTVMRPVTTYRTVRRDCGQWTTQQVYHPGPVCPVLVPDACGVPRVCMTQRPGFTTCKRVWCPRVVEQQVPCTTYQPQVVRQNCPVQVCRNVPEVVVSKCPVQVCRMVCEEVVRMMTQ